MKIENADHPWELHNAPDPEEELDYDNEDWLYENSPQRVGALYMEGHYQDDADIYNLNATNYGYSGPFTITLIRSSDRSGGNWPHSNAILRRRDQESTP